MRLRYRIKEPFQFLSFTFCPKTTLIACFIFSLIVIAALVFAMLTIPQDSNWYNVIFALTTGAVGSSIVSFVIELTSNYRHNKLAWYELQDYYFAITEFETHKQIKMQNTPFQRAEIKAREEFRSAGGVEEFYDEEPKDIIQITWEELPKLIPVLRTAINDKKEFLSDKEIIVISAILADYEQIKFSVRDYILLSPMTYDALNHLDEEYLRKLYPSVVLKNMPDWVRNHLASTESQKACELYAETILSDSFLLSQVMKDYDVSQNGLDDYQSEVDEDEETFRARNEAYSKQMEEENRPFVSWLLSNSCQNISESIDNLEKLILKKPFYGTKLKMDRNSAKESLNGIVAKISYESEKKRLDRLLAKQKNDSSL
ncbi:hypothetical protein FYJ80_02195 [Spirochaetales bacterium NM-380-WT-3C1]|uniref:Uncharacterized protein n=1 Tax=Bullifex porci TaxID=2606638 RepID=A0A7X2PB39_9SPIO|nr:hypothetical protein [Bullifex porci]MSU05593.1 hypothetical protein [Bullifex porci]